MKTNQINMELVDESLYSRQMYAIGRNAMRSMTTASVLITCRANFSGSALELVKCLALAGIRNITVHAKIDILTCRELSSNYYANIDDIGQPFLAKNINSLADLNPNVKITIQKYLTSDVIKLHQCAVFVDYPVNCLGYWNNLCRSNNTKFIMLQSHGLIFNLFCDFGDTHIISNATGDEPKSGLIIAVKDNRIITADPHGLSPGAVIKFDGAIKGLESNMYLICSIKLNQIGISKFIEGVHDKMNQRHRYMNCFGATGIIIPDQLLTNVRFTEIIIPETINHKDLSTSLQSPIFSRFDTACWLMPMVLNYFMKAFDHWRTAMKFIADERTYADDVWETFPLNTNDYADIKKYFYAEIKRTNDQSIISLQNLSTIFDKLVRTVIGVIPGVDAISGAICAQEVIKAVTGRFTPTYQFMHFDALNILPDNYLDTFNLTNMVSDRTPIGSRYDGQIVVFGKNYMEQLQANQIFVVGSGAIGCEHLKNFAMMGIRKMFLTDMDHIEKSNLSRQFLFRSIDIGKSKSETASKRVCAMNPDIEVIAYTKKVSNDTINTYNSEFFEQIDVIATALDNTEARMFVDSLCIKHHKPLLESGTMGVKGSVQTIVPDLTETYADVRDPPDENIPVCTLKLFPYKYEHTIQYAQNIFEEYFNKKIQSYKKVKENPSILETMTPSDLESILQDIKDITRNSKNFKYCINYAYKQFYLLFRDQIVQLQRKYPKDKKESDGTDFWIGNKLYPNELVFDKQISQHMDFMISFANIWADAINLKTKRYTKKKNYEDFVKDLEIPCEIFDDEAINIAKEHKIELPDQPILTTSQKIKKINKLLKSAGTSLDNIKPIEFEKDDDMNHHIDFITAVANLRASNYYIQQHDRFTTKGIAGKIIPAMATTTSVVSGLVSLELYKIAYGYIDTSYNKIEKYRYGAFNLADQTFCFSAPNPPTITLVGNKSFSSWTKYTIQSTQKLKELVSEWSNISIVKNINGKKIENLNNYAFMMDCDKIIHTALDDEEGEDKMLDMALSDIIESMSKDRARYTSGYKHEMMICLEPETQDEAEQYSNKFIFSARVQF